MARRRPQRSGRTLVGSWFAFVLLGYAALLGYQTEEGAPGRPARTWPADLASTGPAGAPLLVMAIHPRCPCTRSSIAELARLSTRLRGRVSIRALIWAPDAPAVDWAPTDLVASVARIPNVEVAPDRGGRMAARLGLATSGHVALFGPSGALEFVGGLTPSRGHEGDSFGREQILAYFDGEAHAARGPVFGCALFDDERVGEVAR